MKWKVRKNTAASLLAIALSLIALAASVLDVRYGFGWQITLPDFGGVIPIICAVVPMAAALMMLLVSILFHAGKSHGLLILGAVGMVLATGSRFAFEMYETLFVNQLPFYPFSAEHLAPAYAFGLLLVVLLTACRALRHSAWNVLAAVLVTVAYLAASITGLGVYTAPYALDISGMVMFTAFALAIALCSTALVRVRKKRRAVPKPAVPVPTDQPAVMPEMARIDALLQEEPRFQPIIHTPVYAQPVQPVQPEPVPAEPVAEPAAEAEPAPAAPVKKARLPKPEEGCVWQWIGTEPDGTFIYQQRRVTVVKETGERIPGPMLPLFYPHLPQSPLPPRQGQ